MTKAIGPWLTVLFPGIKSFMMTINNKSERIDRGRCLSWPVTSYGPEVMEFLVDIELYSAEER